MNTKAFLLQIWSSMPPLVRYFFSDYKSIHAFCERTKGWTNEQIREWQLNKLKDTIEYAYSNTPGYRQLYDEAGVKPADLNNLEDIELFPCVDKALLRDNYKDFTAFCNKEGRLRKAMTGGSTGTPFEFYLTSHNYTAETAFINSSWESIGWNVNDIGIQLRGAHVGSPEHLLVKTGFHRYAISSCYLEECNYEKYMRIIEGSHATFLHVYPSSITDLSHLIISHGDEGRLKIKHIFLGSENLYEWQKDIIKKAFPDSVLFSFYGLSEHVVFADWCKGSDKYHINPFYGYTEVLRGNRSVNAGEVGEIVGTGFWNKGTLFIRYRTNDFASLGLVGCDHCGRNYQLLDSIDGRLAEFVIGKNGRRISLTVFAGSVMHGNTFSRIKQFRFIQFEQGVLELDIVPTEQFDELNMLELQSSINRFLGVDFVCTIKIVNVLPATKRGKFSYLEQHLQIERADIDE